MRPIPTFLTLAAAAVVALTAAPLAARAPSIPAADAPQLAALGPASVGLAHTTVTVPGTARTLAVMVWYPAVTPPGATPETYRRHLITADGPPLDITTEGIAFAGAPAAAGRFPLVVLSHGFGGWAGGMTYLAENLASKNYIVAAIDHADGQGGSGGTEGGCASPGRSSIAPATRRRSSPRSALAPPTRAIQSARTSTPATSP